MERTFREELELAKEHKINVLKLTIANEVNCFLVNGYWWLESNYDDYEVMELFEDICQCVYNIYLAVDNTYSLSNIVEAIIRLVFDDETNIEEINKYMVIEYIQDNF